MSDYVIDASGVLAFWYGEPGAAQVVGILASYSVAMSSVNLSEVVAKVAERGEQEAAIRARLDRLHLEHVDFDPPLAYDAGLLRPATRPRGLSLGDRACLALARRVGVPVITMDRAWAGLDVGVDIRVIR